MSRAKKKLPGLEILELLPQEDFLLPLLGTCSLTWQHKRIQEVHGGGSSSTRIRHQRII